MFDYAKRRTRSKRIRMKDVPKPYRRCVLFVCSACNRSVMIGAKENTQLQMIKCDKCGDRMTKRLK